MPGTKRAKRVSLKAAIIVRVLMAHGSPVTRHQLAAALNQPRLYDHDLKLIGQLVQDGTIVQRRARRLDIVFSRNEQARFEYESFWSKSRREANRYRWGMMGYVYQYQVSPAFMATLREALPAVQPSLFDRLKNLFGL